ncbi:hypothetical protein [Dactylosporangium sp. NPDC049140]|uniref:hypothetical protein n=1 Tax=Dactylosporangium sp. NPDC049140 TaxID=3155647 RepID=UPI00340F74A3
MPEIAERCGRAVGRHRDDRQIQRGRRRAHRGGEGRRGAHRERPATLAAKQMTLEPLAHSSDVSMPKARAQNFLPRVPRVPPVLMDALT